MTSITQLHALLAVLACCCYPVDSGAASFSKAVHSKSPMSRRTQRDVVSSSSSFAQSVLEPDGYPLILSALVDRQQQHSDGDDAASFIASRLDIIDSARVELSYNNNSNNISNKNNQIMLLEMSILIVSEVGLQKALLLLSAIYDNQGGEAAEFYYSSVNIDFEETLRFRSRLENDPSENEEEEFEIETTTIQSTQTTQTNNHAKKSLLLRNIMDDYANYDRINGYSCFLSLTGLTQAMLDLPSKYPNLISISEIGTSYEGRPIYVMIITSKKRNNNNNNNNSNQKPLKGKFLVTGSVHPREYAPPQLLFEYALHLLSNYNTDANIQWILDHTEIHIVPHVNPDGRDVAETSRDLYWRKNVNPGNNDNQGSCGDNDIGVDINRNFEFVWGNTNGASDDPCDDTYMGVSGGSEVETQVVQRYAASIFPESQRKEDPENTKYTEALGEDIMGMYMDIHSYGGYTYYPWGHKDQLCPDAEASEALGRKLSHFNNYELWAPGHDEFQYVVSGDSSDYMYGVVGVASAGLEIGNDFYESCNTYQGQVLPENLPALVYAASVAKKPFSLGKGPDVLEMSVVDGGSSAGEYKVTAWASDSRMVNINGYADFATGDQPITKVELFLDVHPDDDDGSATVWEMEPVDGKLDSTEEEVEAVISISGLGLEAGRHALFAQARDGNGYVGPVSSVFFEVDEVATLPPTRLPTLQPTPTPTRQPTMQPTGKPTETPISSPTESPTTSKPTQTISAQPSEQPTLTISDAPSESPSMYHTHSPTSTPSVTESEAPSQSPSVEPTTHPTPYITTPPSTTSSLNPSQTPSQQTSSTPSASPSNTRSKSFPSTPSSIDMSSISSSEPSTDSPNEPNTEFIDLTSSDISTKPSSLPPEIEVDKTVESPEQGSDANVDGSQKPDTPSNGAFNLYVHGVSFVSLAVLSFVFVVMF